MKITNHTIQLGQLNIAYRQWGDPNGPPLLALHGWLDNSASFDLLAPHMTRFNCVAMDFPGHGLSDHYHGDLPYHFVDAIICVSDFIKVMDWQRLHLLGHSMGGGVACLLAGIQPDIIEKLFIIEGLGPLTETAESAPTQLFQYISRAEKILRRRKPNTYESLDDCAKARAQKGFISEELALILAQRGTQKTEKGYVWRHDPRLYLPSPIRLTEEQVVAFLKSITAPVCFFAGDNGFHYDPDKVKHRFAAISDLTRHVIHGGHHCHMEKPEEIAEIISQF